MADEHRLQAETGTIRVGILDRSNEAVLTIESGDTVVTQTLNHWADGVTPETTIEDIIRLRTQEYPDVGPHTVTGPIAVRGAHPGQMLRVDVLELRPREHGFNLNYPAEFGTGLLPEDFPDGRIQHLSLDLETMTTEFPVGVRLPLRPFLGIMAVAPRDEGPHSTVPPGPHGGNMDLAELVEGTTLYLPIWNEGANFSIGDAHARQGDGEVCLTAIETAMDYARLRLTAVDFSFELPLAETPEHWITMGYSEDLLEATQQAVRSMIALLQDRFAMDRAEAYGFCSIAVDLAVTQVVNKVRGVHAKLAKEFFT